MYEYVKGNYIYRGDKTCGSPVKEVKTISEKEARYWDKLEKQTRSTKR